MQKLKLKYKTVIVSCIEILTNTVSLQNIKHLIILLSIPRKSTKGIDIELWYYLLIV